MSTPTVPAHPLPDQDWASLHEAVDQAATVVKRHPEAATLPALTTLGMVSRLIETLGHQLEA